MGDPSATIAGWIAAAFIPGHEPARHGSINSAVEQAPHSTEGEVR